MNKVTPIIKAVSVSTIILCSSFCSAVAAKPTEQKPSDPSSPPSYTEIESQVSENAIAGSETSTTQVDSHKSDRNLPLLISQTEESEISELEQLNPDPDNLAIPSTAEEVTIDLTQPISIEQAIELALRNNRDLREAELNLERSQKELNEARAALFPTLTSTTQFSNSETAQDNRQLELFDNPDTALDPTTGDSTTSLNGNLRLNYNIYNGGARGADIRRAKKQLEFSQLNLEVVTEQVTFEARRDYYGLQDADSQVRIETAAVEDASQTLRDAQLQEQAGIGTRFDVLRAEVELANAQQRLTTARANQSTARRQLVETLSLGEQVDILTSEEEPTKAGEWTLSLEESIITAYGNRAELEQFLINREINKEQKQIALAQIRPTLSVFGELDYLDIADDDVDLTTGYTVGAQLQWTIFDGGAAKARARQEDIDVALADNGFANQKNQVRVEVEQAFFGLEANEKNISTATKAVELAEESLRLARLRFEAGVGTQTDVIEAQTELTTARGNFVRAVIDYNQSLNQIQRAITGNIE